MQVAFDTGHVLAFGLISLCIFACLPTQLSPLSRAGRTLLICMVLGALSEAAQIPIARDASWHDLMSDWFGAAAFVGVAVVVTASNAFTRVQITAITVLALGMLTWALWPLARTSLAYLERFQQLPQLVKPDSTLSNVFIRRQFASVTRVQQPDGTAIQVELLDGAWPGITFHDLWPDWRNYSTLVLQIVIDGTTPFDLNVRIHDRSHQAGEQNYSDRFNRQFRLTPGMHVLRINLDEVKKSPRDREMRLAQVEGIILFGRQQDAGRIFRVQDLRLEP
ncbi:MAG: VanZ family protein [Woeseia sp.]